MNYQIFTDSCCDFPAHMYQELGVTCVPLSVEFRGEVTDDRNDDSLKELYDGLRAGEIAQTSAVNPTRWSDAMAPVLAAGKDILVLAFSSALSTTYQSAVIAADEMSEKYPDRTIRVVDTLSASMGQGLLVWYACKKRDEGMDLEALYNWTLENRKHICHWVTVDDLMYLKRGGRVSASTALVGTMLQIKPILRVDDAGALNTVSKARGRKAAIDAMVRKLQELGEGYENETVFITHGDCIADAHSLEQLVKEKCGVKNVVISYVGSVVGSHAGPGTLTLFFMGTHR